MQKQYRLTDRADFNKVYRYGKSTANRQFVVYYMVVPSTEHFKLGVSISKKIGNAVVRNRLKRQIKEILRLDSTRIKNHYHFIVICRQQAAMMDYHQMRRSLIHVLKRAQLWNNDNVKIKD